MDKKKAPDIEDLDENAPETESEDVVKIVSSEEETS